MIEAHVIERKVILTGYKNDLKQLKFDKYIKINQKMIYNLIDKNTREVWMTLKDPLMKATSTMCSAVSGEDWIEVYRNKYAMPQKCIDHQSLVTMTDLPSRCPWGVEDIEQIIRNLKHSKAAGPDGIPPCVIKDDPKLWALCLLSRFECVFQSKIVPPSWLSAIVIPLHKKGPLNDPGNFRPIALIDVSAKTFAALILRDLNEFIATQKILSRFQTGFRKGMGRQLNATILAHLLKL